MKTGMGGLKPGFRSAAISMTLGTAAGSLHQRLHRCRQIEHGIPDRLVTHGLKYERLALLADPRSPFRRDQGPTKFLVVPKQRDRDPACGC